MKRSTPARSFIGGLPAGRIARFICVVFIVLDRLEMLGLLPEARDDGVGELLGADLLARRAFLVDVVGVNAVFDRAQPGVMDALGDVGLADVHEHQNRAVQQARGIGEVLTCAARRRAVNRLEHRAVIADVRRTRQADRAGDLRRDVGEHVAVKIRHHDHVEGFGRVGHLGGADVDDPVLVLDLGILGAISLKVRWKSPSVIFMMLSLVKHVTFLRLLARAYSNA